MILCPLSLRTLRRIPIIWVLLAEFGCGTWLSGYGLGYSLRFPLNGHIPLWKLPRNLLFLLRILNIEFNQVFAIAFQADVGANLIDLRWRNTTRRRAKILFLVDKLISQIIHFAKLAVVKLLSANHLPLLFISIAE